MRSDQAQGSPLCPPALLLWEHVPPENMVSSFLFVPYLIDNNIFIYFVPSLLPVEEQGTEAEAQKGRARKRRSSLPSILFLQTGERRSAGGMRRLQREQDLARDAITARRIA
jgi:hypothetical protein